MATADRDTVARRADKTANKTTPARKPASASRRQRSDWPWSQAARELHSAVEWRQAAAVGGTAMVDVETHKPVRVIADPLAGPYIMVSQGQVEKVRSILQNNGVEHWVDHHAVSVNGSPYIVAIWVAKRLDAGPIQELLDNAA
jgi:hypothetical protein